MDDQRAVNDAAVDAVRDFLGGPWPDGDDWTFDLGDHLSSNWGAVYGGATAAAAVALARLAAPDDVVLHQVDGVGSLRLLEGTDYGFGDVSIPIIEAPPNTTDAYTTHRHGHTSMLVITYGRGCFTIGAQTWRPRPETSW